MAKIFIFGGSGRVATDLIKNLVADGNTITAAARHPENIIKLDGVTAEKLDLHADVDNIAKQVKGFAAIYFTAGSRGKDLIQKDAMGAIKTMMAAEKAGVKRYIMLSSMLSLDTVSYTHLYKLATRLIKNSSGQKEVWEPVIRKLFQAYVNSGTTTLSEQRRNNLMNFKNILDEQRR